MGFVSHKVKRSDLEAGDHIYTYRVGFTYSHHGIYVGEDRVVHFTKNPTSTCCSETFCGFRKVNSGVTQSCLNCFMRNTSLRRYEYGVSRCAFLARIRGGTCTTAESDDPKAVIHRATYLLYNGFGGYNLFRNNCEDFALYCKTGFLVSTKRHVGGSGQVWSALSLPSAAAFTAGSGRVCLEYLWFARFWYASLPSAARISVPPLMFGSNPVAFTVVVVIGSATVIYIAYRCRSDFGLQTAVKVEAKDISAFLAANNCGD